MDDRPIELVKDRAADLLAAADAALDAGAIDDAEWHRRIAAVITPAYLVAATPWAPARSGDAASWEHARPARRCRGRTRQASSMSAAPVAT